MTLENKLFELATLVDYGTYYLTKEPKFSIRDMAMYISENSIDPSEFYDAWDIVHTYYASDLLNEMHEDDIVNWVRDNYEARDLVDLDISVDWN